MLNKKKIKNHKEDYKEIEKLRKQTNRWMKRSLSSPTAKKLSNKEVNIGDCIDFKNKEKANVIEIEKFLDKKKQKEDARIFGEILKRPSICGIYDNDLFDPPPKAS